MATLISPFKKLIFLISFVILLTGIFFGFVSIQNCVRVEFYSKNKIAAFEAENK